MIARELKIGDWFKCEYKGRARVGMVKKLRYATAAESHFVGYIPMAFLVVTENGYRTYKFEHMAKVELVA